MSRMRGEKVLRKVLVSLRRYLAICAGGNGGRSEGCGECREGERELHVDGGETGTYGEV